MAAQFEILGFRFNSGRKEEGRRKKEEGRRMRQRQEAGGRKSNFGVAGLRYETLGRGNL